METVWIKTADGATAEVSVSSARHMISRGDAVQIPTPKQPKRRSSGGRPDEGADRADA